MGLDGHTDLDDAPAQDDDADGPDRGEDEVGQVIDDGYILACDEVAEILDKTGLSKEEREAFTQIERHLSLIARQGRAFGMHLLLSTQRPSADLIPGQIRSNLALRICGRADDILSRIILDSPAAADQISLDAKGRFVTNMGQSFQGYLFDDSILEEN